MPIATDVISGSAPIVMWGALIVFNAAVMRLLYVIFAKIDLKAILREKAATAGAQAPAAGAGAAAADDTSYSRVAGMIGSVVMSSFFWALGNVILYKAFGAVADIATLLTGVSSFLLAGAAVFAPYAFNQLSKAFKPG